MPPQDGCRSVDRQHAIERHPAPLDLVLGHLDLVVHLPIHEAERVLSRRDLSRGENYNTMAGFVLWHLGRMPVPGEKLAWRDLSIEVVDMDGLVIDKLLVNTQGTTASTTANRLQTSQRPTLMGLNS